MSNEGEAIQEAPWVECDGYRFEMDPNVLVASREEYYRAQVIQLTNDKALLNTALRQAVVQLKAQQEVIDSMVDLQTRMEALEQDKEATSG